MRYRSPSRWFGSASWQQPLVRIMLRRSAIGVSVVGQNTDYFALSNDAHSAFANHPFQLSLESGKASNTRFDLSQLFLSNGISRRAGLLGVIGQTQKLFDRLKGEAEFARVPNERQSLDVRRFVNALISGCSGRGGN